MTMTRMKAKCVMAIAVCAAVVISTGPALAVDTQAQLVPVTVKNFQRAESDHYFNNFVKLGAFGKF